MKLSVMRAFVAALTVVLFGFTQSPSSGLLWFERTDQNFAVWAPFGEEHAGAVRFQDWVARAKSGQPLIDFNNRLVLNCWEYVLYTGLRLKTVSVETVQSHYDAIAQSKPLSMVLGTLMGVVPYTIESGVVNLRWSFTPQAGDVIFMDETSHVVQATGQRTADGRVQVISFSPRPIWGDGSRYWAEPNTRPELTTLESLIEQMMELYPDVPSDWNNIELKVVRPPIGPAISEMESLSRNKKISVAEGEFVIESKWKKIEQTSDAIDVLYGRVKFTPKFKDFTPACNNISFIQSARVLDNAGQNYKWPSGQQARNRMMTKKSANGVAAGFFIDHDASLCAESRECSPFYRDSWPNTQDGSHDGASTPGRTSSAVLIDYPFGWEFISSISLEACAVCRDDMKIYGCATWGGTWPPVGERFVHEVNASNLPSATFSSALLRFQRHYRQ
ncbi:MAG: hypothetical protein RJB13_1626 [Pseudomonadota bacterium]